MPTCVLNVRDFNPTKSNIVRIDNRNQALAYDCLFETALLYASRDDHRHGYFGTADIIDVRVDVRAPRFLLLELGNISLFVSSVLPGNLEHPIEASAYDTNGRPIFQYFSPGIRPLTSEERIAASELREATARTGFMEALDVSVPDLDTSVPEMERSRILKHVAVRDRRLRNSTLLIYGAICAICRRDYADLARGLYEVEICHLHAVALGGSDDVTNSMPMCRLHHWAYDVGLFTMSDAGIYQFSKDMSQNLKDEFRGHIRAFYPGPQFWPKAENLAAHRQHVFRP